MGFILLYSFILEESIVAAKTASSVAVSQFPMKCFLFQSLLTHNPLSLGIGFSHMAPVTAQVKASLL